MVDSEIFLDEYPRWGLGTPYQLVVLHEMFLHATGSGQKEVECMFCQGCWGSVPKPEPRVDQSAMELVGYQTSRKEMRDIYHSVYLLRRTPGTPSCGEQQRRRAIHDKLASLMVRLQRQMHPTTTEYMSPHTGGWFGLDQQESYKVALWAAFHRAFETAEALQSDLERLGSEQRRRSQAHSKARVGVGLGFILETGLGLTPELGPGPALEASLGIVLGLTVKATIMVTYRVYVPGPQSDLCPEGE